MLGIAVISLLKLATSLSSPTPTGPIHTLILTRHGDSLWNGKAPGSRETFTGWTDVPLSSIGETEAVNTGKLLSQYTSGINIDALFTSTLGRARMTAHHCWWAYYERLELEHRQMKQYQYYNPPDASRQIQQSNDWVPKQFIIDHRLNERHYGSLQGLVKSDAEAGLHGHSPADVKQWRRSWHAIPPLLEDNDPRRIEDLRLYRDICGGAENVPRGESLAMVAKERIRPFLAECLTPLLDDASLNSRQSACDSKFNDQSTSEDGGTALIVAHANSLRALIGVICNVENDDAALRKLESMKIPTASPLMLRYRRSTVNGMYCPVDCTVDNEMKTDLPVYPLSSVQLSMLRRRKSEQSVETTTSPQVTSLVA
jgi:2,3-bisphosphoglycerate-dependent phosphoglycerate mutase